jgi:alkylated DNA repair dioxygenase AlkB
MLARQLGLFGNEEPDFDGSFGKVRRLELEDGAWLEHEPGFLGGHAQLFERLLETTHFHTETRQMYDREVTVPRCHARLPEDGPGHPIIQRVQAALSARYGEEFERVSLALYRDGHDSVAFHGDYVARKLPEALVASISLGAPRRFLLRRTSGATHPTESGQRRSIALSLGAGDLLVMGGTCQRTYQHAVPKVAHAEPRLAVMFRPIWLDPG